MRTLARFVLFFDCRITYNLRNFLIILYVVRTFNFIKFIGFFGLHTALFFFVCSA